MDDIDLIGKFITVALHAEEARDLTLGPPRSESGFSPYWVLGGTIEGQTSQLGLWLQISTIQDAKGTELSMPDNMGLLLLPWNVVRRAILREKKPDQIAPVSFIRSAKSA